jgi:hypothetical protein
MTLDAAVPAAIPIAVPRLLVASGLELPSCRACDGFAATKDSPQGQLV